jgi:ribosome-associated protein
VSADFEEPQPIADESKGAIESDDAVVEPTDLAADDEETVDGETVDGETVDGETVDGETVDGETVDGETVDGETAGADVAPKVDATIRLDQFLKLSQVAQTGGHAKVMIQSGEVLVNGDVETRRRRKLVPGDEIEVDGERYVIFDDGE